MSWRDWFQSARSAAKEKADNMGMPKCTYCGGTEWLAGPTGGMAQNILCANPTCRHWFNYVPPPFNIFDDIKRVEPLEEEYKHAQEVRVKAADAERAKRRKEGERAYETGASIDSLRTSHSHGNENVENMDRIAGFLDALAAEVRGTPR